MTNQPTNHVDSDYCGCIECCPDYSAGGQVDPAGLTLTVRWSSYDCIAHAEVEDHTEDPEYLAEYGLVSLVGALDDTLPLARRIEGRKFPDAAALVDYLTGTVGLSREDFA